MLFSQTYEHTALLIVPLLIGMALGAAFLGSLWMTIQKLPTSRRPFVLYLASFVLRMSLVGAVFYLLMIGGNWTWPVAGLIGFVLIRTVGVRAVAQEQFPHSNGKVS